MRKRKILTSILGAILVLLLTACAAGPGGEAEETLPSQAEEPSPAQTEPAGESVPTEPTEPDSQQEPEQPDTDEEETTDMKVNVSVNGETFTATLEENQAVDAWLEKMEEAPITIQMSDYAGFEKVGDLGTSLPASDRQTTTQAGDIVLYQGDQIVIFYGSNSWSYTRLGKIDDLTGWAQALGSGDVTVTFSLAQPQP